MKFLLSLLFATVLATSVISGPIVSDESDDLMYNPDLYQGDIAGVKVDKLKGLAKVPDNSYDKWPGGVVPYIIQGNTYTQSELNVINEGMKWIEDQTRVNGRDCIRFVPRTNEATYLQIYSDSGCWSYVGRQTWSGPQPLSLQKARFPGQGTCVWAGTVAHELIHALGFWHEQSRPDRDDYITINYENIVSGLEYNFDKYTEGIDTMGFPYDVYSIMHYEWNAFSANGKPTIVAKQPGVDLVNAAFKNSLTDIDVGELRRFYGCA